MTQDEKGAAIMQILAEVGGLRLSTWQRARATERILALPDAAPRSRQAGEEER